MKNGKKVVITYGTFDLFHVGHLRLLKRAKALGDYLIVGVSTDEFNEIKGKKAIIPYEQRKEIVEAIRYVDLVIPEKSWEQKVEDIKKYGVDVLVMGDDWKGKFDHLRQYVEVVYLPRTEGISSSMIRTILSSASKINVDELRQAIETLEKLDLNALSEALEIIRIFLKNLK